MNREQLEQAVIQWGDDKKLVDPIRQTLKFMAEAGELSDEVCKNVNSTTFIPFDQNSEKFDNLIKEIGDVEVTLTILKRQLGIEQDKPLEEAYNKIKNRTGKTLNGTFQKD